MGYPHPDHLLKQLTSSQVSEWEAYDRLDPIGKWRDELGFASLSSLIVNIVRTIYAKKGTTPKDSTPTDFMMKWGYSAEEQKPEPKQQSVEDMKTIMEGIASTFKNKEK